MLGGKSPRRMKYEKISATPWETRIKLKYTTSPLRHVCIFNMHKHNMWMPGDAYYIYIINDLLMQVIQTQKENNVSVSFVYFHSQSCPWKLACHFFNKKKQNARLLNFQTELNGGSSFGIQCVIIPLFSCFVTIDRQQCG